MSTVVDSPHPGTSEPQQSRAHPEATGTPGRIVVGVDGSESSLTALRRGIRIAKALNAPLDAITTWEGRIGYGGMGESYSPVHDAELILSQASTAEFGAQVPHWFTSHTVEGRAEQILIEQSADAEMLILGSRGHAGLAGVLLGSVSAACAEHPHCPVLIMH